MEQLTNRLNRIAHFAHRAAKGNYPKIVESLRKKIYETAYHEYFHLNNQLDIHKKHPNLLQEDIEEINENIQTLEDWMRDYEPLGYVTQELNTILKQNNWK